MTMITFAGIEYTPRCVRVKAGSTVVFSGAFANHPLMGGQVTGGAPKPDPTSVVPATSSGTEATAIFTRTGSYPYYCTLHVGSGMMGAVFVE
jgi:plastocyanin